MEGGMSRFFSRGTTYRLIKYGFASTVINIWLLECSKSICLVTLLLPTDINIFYDVIKDCKANNKPVLWTSIILLMVNPEPNNTN